MTRHTSLASTACFRLLTSQLSFVAVCSMATVAAFGQPNFTAPALLNAPQDTAMDTAPAIAGDGQGVWIVAWHADVDTSSDEEAFDILISRSTDNGQTWSDPPTAPPLSNGTTNDLHPSLATDGEGNWVLVWQSGNAEDDVDFDIKVSQSTDNGQTWSNATVLNTNGNIDEGNDYFPAVATDAQGAWLAAWSSGENLSTTLGTDFDILFAMSTNNGASWTDPQSLNTDADTDDESDILPRVAADGLGTWVATWAQSADVIFVARSTDNGSTWSDPEPLADEDFYIGSDVATDGAGTWLVMWATYDVGTTAVDVARSVDNGATWNPAASPQPSDGNNPMGSYFPSLATDGAGTWIGVWSTEPSSGVGFSYDADGLLYGNDLSVLISQSTDDGPSWTQPVPIINDFESSFPFIASDRSGGWLVAWASTSNLGDAVAIGSDRDILFSRFDIPLPAPPAPAVAGVCPLGLMTMLVLFTFGLVKASRRWYTVSGLT